MFNEQVLAKIGISKEDIHFVNDLAYTAGQTAKKRYEDGLTDIETKSEPDDFVTEVDKELSYFLTGKLKERFPDFNIISEEETPDSNINNDITTWVIDPIDGTSNYINNDGKYSVMIGLLRNCIPLIGWVYIPSEDRLIVGIPDDGLYEKKSQNEIYKKEINTENTLPEKKIKLMMGRRDRKNNPQIKDKISQFELVESGSIGIKVIEIIEKKAHVFIHTVKKLKLWDTVAPSAIAIAAKLHLSSFENEPVRFSVFELQLDQTYTVGYKWAIDSVLQTINN